MARVRMTMAQIAVSEDVDRDRVAAISEADICRHMREDGEDPDTQDAAYRTVLPPIEVRRRTGLSRPAFARAIGVPLATVSDWEERRTLPDPAAASLLALVADDPQRALTVLRPSALPGVP